MSIQRECKKCGRLEPFRLNFGADYEAEKKFHSEEGCLKMCNEHEVDSLGESIL